MKNKCALILVGLVLCPSIIFAAGTAVITCSNIMGGITRTVTFSWVDDTAGTTKSTDSTQCLNQTVTSFIDGYYLCNAETSTTAARRPTDDYDITILDSLSVDKMGGALLNRDSNSTEEAAPAITSGSTTGFGCKYITSALTFTLSGNSVNGATGATKLYFSRPEKP